MNAADQRALGIELIGIIRRDRARRTRSASFRKFLNHLFAALLTSYLTALLGGWMFMLAVGVVHAEWIPQVPTIGYWWAVLISWLFRGALAARSSAGSERAR